MDTSMWNTWLHRGIRMLAALALASTVAPGSAQAATADPFVPQQVVVRLAHPSQLAAVAAAYQLSPTPIDQLPNHDVFLLALADPAASADAVAAKMAADPRVEYAEPNYVGLSPEQRNSSSWETGGDAGAYFGQWVPAAMRLGQAHTRTRGAGVTVAVLDSGVDAAHPVLAGRLVGGFDFVDNRSYPSPVPGGPAVAHGTHVAGLVALAAPEAKIMPVRVLDEAGRGDAWRLAKALVWASDPDGNPTTADGAAVLNLSISTLTRTHLMTDLIEEVANGQRGVVLVAAAGNSASMRPEFPAGEGGSRLLSVGASTAVDTLAPFSNSGSWVDVAAPGDRILSSLPGGAYGTWSGTSMAAALASGEAALVRAAFPALRAREVIERMQATSVPIPGAVPLRLDAAAAVAG